MQETGNNRKISVRVGSEAYLYSNGSARSEWLGAARIFSTDDFHKEYDEVEISVFTPAFTLVPENFFNPDKAEEQLGEVYRLSASDEVKSCNIPEIGAVAVFSISAGTKMSSVVADMISKSDGQKAEVLPEQYWILKEIFKIPDYNKVLASYAEGRLYLAIAQGKTLLLCNSYQAQDFTTAEYFLFSALRKFQLNPEVTTIWFRTPLTDEQTLSLYNYFKQVESI